MIKLLQEEGQQDFMSFSRQLFQLWSIDYSVIGYLLQDSFFLNPLKKLTFDLPRVLTVQMMFIPSMIVTEVWYDVNDANDVQ